MSRANLDSESPVRQRWLPLEDAARTVVAFQRRFGMRHLNLACHAALPLILTPELLNLIHINFFNDWQEYWIAEADLLLSSLCRPIGEATYEVEPAIREVLLVDLEDRYGCDRLFDLACFLETYLDKSGTQQRLELAKTQRWIARAYLNADDTLKELENFHQKTTTQPEDNPQTLPDRIRLALTLELLTEPLYGAGDRDRYARLVDSVRSLERELYGVPAVVSPATLERVETPATPLPSGNATNVTLQTFDFETVRVNAEGQVVERIAGSARYFVEQLAEGVTLEMVAIPGGSFDMGAAEGEEGASKDEYPQHPVTVPPFFLGKYPVTQAQWRAVAKLPQLERELKLDPSSFKGDNRPVECVSWKDAMEFCARLAKHTGRDYRLPSEAEWEYACRAGTQTPFHFGETITTDLANYDGNSTYASAPKGEYRNKTTPVGVFPPNGFGLYDMHGNVWEWCADPWHENYKGAPDNDRVWDEKSENDNDYQNVRDRLKIFLSDNRSRVLRGGSWFILPGNCRSAFRLRGFVPVVSFYLIGFRVACGAARTS